MAKRKEPPDPPDNRSNLDDLLDKVQDGLNKAFGDGSVGRLNAGNTLSQVDTWVSTRSIVVDSVIRGTRHHGSSLIPFGRQVEIAGVENSGKTTLCAQIIAETQAIGGMVVVTDSESRISHDYWDKLGVDTARIIRIQAPTVEEVFNKQCRAITAIKELAPDTPLLMVWDSIGGTSISKIVDAADNESYMEQAEKAMMKKAKVISNGIELINTMVSRSNCCYLYTNHVYQKVGMGYGDMTETPGGRKLKYFATLRLRLTPIGKIKEEDDGGTGDKIIGIKVKVAAVKNSMAGILLEREAVIMAGRGFDNDYSMFELAPKYGLISKSGAWSTWTNSAGDEVKFQGFKGFMEKVVIDPGYGELIKQVVSNI